MKRAIGAGALLLSIARDAHAEPADVAAAQSLQAILDDGAASERKDRTIGAVAGLAVGATLTGVGIGLLADGLSKPSMSSSTETALGAGFLAGGGVALVVSPLIFFIPGDLESFAERTKPLARQGRIGQDR